MAQARYKITSSEDRRRLIRSYLNGGDFISLDAREMDIKRTTAYRIVRNGIPDTPIRGGARNLKLDDEMREFCRDQLGRNPLITHKELNNLLRITFPNKPRITETSIKNMLDGMFVYLEGSNGYSGRS